MPSMIETLIGAGVQRPDDKRLVPTRRPLPGRPRDLFELFVTLGQQASLPSLNVSADFRQTDPRHITYVTLGRWPTLKELEQIPDPYSVPNHLRALLAGQEFRTHLVRRLCDAYPERPRLFYVQIPRCAGGHFLHLSGTMHPIFPPELASWRRGDQARFIPALGIYLSRFNSTRTIQVVLPRLAPFTQAAQPAGQDSLLPWSLNAPPRRPGDRLFTIVREPAGLILSQVNAILTRLASPAGGDDPATAKWRTRLDALPPTDDAAAWKAIGRKVLAALPTRNPLCHALGDGTASSALQACRMSDVEIADLTHYTDWTKYTWDVEPEPATNVSRPVLTVADLNGAQAAHLAGLVDEDLAFYAPIAALLAVMPETRTAIRGREL